MTSPLLVPFGHVTFGLFHYARGDHHSGRADRLNSGHVRAMSPAVLAVIQSGVNHSPSFQTLIERLEDSDVIVYVRSEHASIGSLHGSLTYVSKVGGARYLIVRLFGKPGIRQVAVLGHELQHAVEIAERPEIVDEASLLRAYAQFGTVKRSRTAGGTHVADTTAAVAWRLESCVK